MASSTQGFSLLKKSGTDDAATTKKTAAAEDGEIDATTGVMAKTEAGEGMFGADLDMDSLTDSDGDDEDDYDDGSESDEKLKRKKKDKEERDDSAIQKDEKSQQFKIVAGEDSDSIFEERL